MSDPFFSPSWYRVAHLVPTLRRHVRLHRHLYRGQIGYVLQDPVTGRCHRLAPAAHQLAARMDGHSTVEQIWEAANAQLGDDGPTQDETIRLLGLLHSADVLRCDVSPDTAEILRRCQRRESSEWWRRFTNPLAVKVRLVDPDAFLERWVHLVRPLLRWPTALLAAAVVIAAAMLAGQHWTELTTDAAARLLAPRNLLLLWLAYPLMKILHELGHAFAVKAWGGHVHEMGLLVLVMMPVPYVDASDATVWPDKWRRAAVGSAGVVVELLIASLALFVWASVEPGLLRELALDLVWIGGVSALLINGNPLLRFDGYYVLSDLIEIPNLRRRAQQYLSWLAMHRGFGLSNVRNPVMARGEAGWLLAFGVCSSLYRLVVILGIAWFVSGRFFVFGVLLACFALATQVLLPVGRGLVFVLTSPRLDDRRGHAVGLTAAGLAAFALVTCVVPLPLYSRAEGVVRPPEGAHLRVQASGFVIRMLATPGARVHRGQPLIHTRDPELETVVRVTAAQLRALLARRHAERFQDRVRAQMTDDEIESVEASLARARERVGDVVLRSPADGRFVVPRGADLEGRFVEQGDLLGYVIGDEAPSVRVVIPQSDAALVRDSIRAVDVRLASRLDRVFSATVERDVPGATERLPSPALGSAGGGAIPVDPSDPDGLRALAPVFQLDLAIPRAAAVGVIGERVYVRFDHGAEPVARRGIRSVQRLFLRRLGG